MPSIHLITGFLGFGKTTLAKNLEQQLDAIRFTHDEIMLSRFGRNPSDFQAKYRLVDKFIKDETAKYISQGQDVILDYGFWTHKTRQDYYNLAKTLTDDVFFHLVYCDMCEAKKRVLERTKSDKNSLFIDEKIFNELLKKYEPWNDEDDYPVVLHNAPNTQYIGKTVKVCVDRPKESNHPKFGFKYEVNYGFIPFTKSPDGEELDAYLLMLNEPVHEYVGRCTALIHRLDDDDDKLIVVPKSFDLDDQSIEQSVAFQEKFFKHVLIRNSPDQKF